MASSQVLALHEEVCRQFYNDLLESVKECKQYFIDKMIESVQEAVYDAYTPTLYERRMGDGGLSDPNNFDLQMFLDRNGEVTIFMKNMTTGAGHAFYIDEGIVTGKNFYDWERSQAYYLAQQGQFQRDFYTLMEYKVYNDNELENLIKRGMEKRGWKSN